MSIAVGNGLPPLGRFLICLDVEVDEEHEITGYEATSENRSRLRSSTVPDMREIWEAGKRKVLVSYSRCKHPSNLE